MCDSLRGSSSMLCLQSDIATQKEKHFIYTNTTNSTYCIKRGVQRFNFFSRQGGKGTAPVTGQRTGDQHSRHWEGTFLIFWLHFVLFWYTSTFVPVSSHTSWIYVPSLLGRYPEAGPETEVLC